MLYLFILIRRLKLCFRMMAVIYTDMCLYSAELRSQFLTSLYPISFTRVIKKKMHMTSKLWEWVLHCKALSTVIKESLRIQRLRPRTTREGSLPSRMQNLYLDFHTTAVSSSHTFSLKCRMLGKDSVCTIFKSLVELGGDRTHSLPYAKQTLYHYANAGIFHV